MNLDMLYHELEQCNFVSDKAINLNENLQEYHICRFCSSKSHRCLYFFPFSFWSMELQNILFTEVYVLSPPQVKLSQCTKLVDPGLRPLCEQSIYIDESPASSFKKTLCCDSCAFSSIKENSFLANKANRLRLGLGAVGIFVLLLLCVVAIFVYKCVVARSPVGRMKGGRS